MNLIEITALLSFLMDFLAFMSIDFGLMASISFKGLNPALILDDHWLK